MKTGKICKKKIIMSGFSKQETESVKLSLRENFPGSSVFVQERKDMFSLGIMPPATISVFVLARELFPLFNIQQ